MLMYSFLKCYFRLCINYGPGLDLIHYNLVKPEAELLHVNKGLLGLCPHPSVTLSSPPSAAFLKSECPSTALSWAAVRQYQRSLEGRSASKAKDHEEGGAAISSRDTPVAKRKRTTTPGEGDTAVCMNTLHTGKGFFGRIRDEG